MRHFKDKVIILKSINYSESDKVLTVLGKNFGKYALLAKGVRKIESKNRGHIQTLSIANISFYKANGLPLLIEANSEYLPEYSSQSIKNIERCLQIVNKFLPEDVEHKEIFDGLYAAVTSDFSIEKVNRFRLFFLIKEGLVGDLEHCSVCGEKVSYLDQKNWEVYCDHHVGSNSKNMIKLEKDIYTNSKFTLELDKYVNKILSNS